MLVNRFPVRVFSEGVGHSVLAIVYFSIEGNRVTVFGYDIGDLPLTEMQREIMHDQIRDYFDGYEVHFG